MTDSNPTLRKRISGFLGRGAGSTSRGIKINVEIDHEVELTVTGERSDESKGCEVWVLGVAEGERRTPIHWDAVTTHRGEWSRVRDDSAPAGFVMRSCEGTLRWRVRAGDPIVRLLRHPWSGLVELRYGERSYRFDLYAPTPCDLVVHLDTGKIEEPEKKNGKPRARQGQSQLGSDERNGVVSGRNGHARSHDRPAIESSLSAGRARLVADDLQARGVKTLAVYVPRWKGVAASTRSLFEHALAFPESEAVEPYGVEADEIEVMAQALAEAGIEHLILSGGDEIHLRLAKRMKAIRPGVRCDMLWHASYVQFSEDYTWRLLRLWIDAAREGLVHSIGTVKQGMDRFFTSRGVRSCFVMNYVARIPESPSCPDAGGPHLGLWLAGSSYRKLPHAMLAAAAMIPCTVLHGSNFEGRPMEVAQYLGLDGGRLEPHSIDPADLEDRIRASHLTLYVTFSECAPMLPLESLSLGVPCLVGPNSHLFLDDDYLASRLVVPNPDRADTIADWIERALAERDQIIEAYKKYAPGYNARARRSVVEFLSS